MSATPPARSCKSSDLGSIATLGFRGEALASIAAVARVTCTTRTKEQVSGIQAVNEGGVIKSIEDAACPQGTSFVVRDLFFNTPVRLKFLKKPQTEAGLVSDLMMRMILSKPEVSFRYTNQGKLMYHSAGDGKLESAVFSIYGNELLHTMRRVEGCMNGVVLNGYVGIGESARGNRNHQSFFINGRYMRSNILSAALENGARERVMIGKYPTCVLAPDHALRSGGRERASNKLEVRFQREAAVMEAVETLVREALRDRDAFERPVEMLLTPEKPAVPEIAVTKSAQLPPATVQTAQGISPASAVTRSTAVPAITAQPVARPRAAASPRAAVRRIAGVCAAYCLGARGAQSAAYGASSAEGRTCARSTAGGSAEASGGFSGTAGGVAAGGEKAAEAAGRGVQYIYFGGIQR